MADNKELLHQHYKKHACSYDSLRDEHSIVTRTNATDQINFVLKHFDGINEIVEVGCGTGKFTIPLARAGKKVVAFDYAEEMLDIVKEKALAEGLEDRIELKHGDIENLNISSGSAKAVLSIAVLRHFENEKRAISELARILDTSGILIIDYLSSMFFKPYDLCKKIFLKKTAIKGDEWFENYYRNYNSMTKVLNLFELEVVKRQGFVLLPTNITEKLHLTIPVKYVERKTGLGGVVFLVSKKQTKCI